MAKCKHCGFEIASTMHNCCECAENKIADLKAQVAEKDKRILELEGQYVNCCMCFERKKLVELATDHGCREDVCWECVAKDNINGAMKLKAQVAELRSTLSQAEKYGRSVEADLENAHDKLKVTEQAQIDAINENQVNLHRANTAEVQVAHKDRVIEVFCNHMPLRSVNMTADDWRKWAEAKAKDANDG